MLYPIKDLLFRRMKRLKGEIPDYYSYKLNEKVRHKLIGTILDFEVRGEFDDLVIHIERELGKNISSEYSSSAKIQDFMFNCPEDEFLSIIEILISIKFSNYKNAVYHDRNSYPSSKTISLRKNVQSFINTINKTFKVDKIGYEIVPASLPNLPYIIVPFNSKYLYVETIKEPMSLLYDAKFEGPLNEFELALDDYRNEKYEDTIHKSNKSYESTLKTILDLKKIDFNPSKEKIPQLVQKIQDETDIIDSSFRDIVNPFMSILKKGPNIIRNMEGIGHGQGMDVKEMEKSYANFVLRLTGTYIVFLIERYNETK
jgi:hypothetical protein